MNDSDPVTTINLTTTTPISKYKNSPTRSIPTMVTIIGQATDNSFINDSMYPLGNCDSPYNLKKQDSQDDASLSSPSVIKLKKVKFLEDVIKKKMPLVKVD